MSSNSMSGENYDPNTELKINSAEKKLQCLISGIAEAAESIETLACEIVSVYEPGSIYDDRINAMLVSIKSLSCNIGHTSEELGAGWKQKEKWLYPPIYFTKP